jgi:hypothetical protein
MSPTTQIVAEFEVWIIRMFDVCGISNDLEQLVNYLICISTLITKLHRRWKFPRGDSSRCIMKIIDFCLYSILGKQQFLHRFSNFQSMSVPPVGDRESCSFLNWIHNIIDKVLVDKLGLSTAGTPAQNLELLSCGSIVKSICGKHSSVARRSKRTYETQTTSHF